MSGQVEKELADAEHRAEVLASALRIIRIWARFDHGSPETREEAMADIESKASQALEETK